MVANAYYLMNSDGLPTLAPKLFRFNDIDQYRTAVRNLAVEFTPLVRKISAAQTILNLPGCDINFAQSFPRIAEGQLAPNCTAVGFSMDDGLPIRFNGVERDRPAIVIWRNGAAYTTVERTERQSSRRTCKIVGGPKRVRIGRCLKRVHLRIIGSASW
ncbi:hypothetical protein ACFIOY_40270 [Bradyrhizobium sp. TZ2]